MDVYFTVLPIQSSFIQNFYSTTDINPSVEKLITFKH